MTELFHGVFRTGVHGSVVILVVLFLRLVLRKAPKRYICLMWLLAMLRLLMPVSIESPLSLQPQVDPVVWSQTGSFRYDAVAAVVWIIGAAVLLFYSVISYAALKLRLRESIRVSPGVWESDRIDTAFILGYFRPRIYLPMGIQGLYRDMMLQHERGHLKRLDHWMKLVGFVALAIYWFDPLVWAAYVLLCWDMEYACDELVISDMNLQQRKCYSAALLACSSNSSYLAVSPVTFGEKPIKKRIRAVLHYRKPSFGLTALTVAALVIVAVCFLTDPKIT